MMLTFDIRYVLKKRYDRGAFGEVWLAVHWNCSSGDASTGSSEVGNVYLGDSYENCSSMDSSGGNLFILKRIMVCGFLSSIWVTWFASKFISNML